VDGTESTAQGRAFGAEDGYGILNMSWTGAEIVCLADLIIEVLLRRVCWNFCSPLPRPHLSLGSKHATTPPKTIPVC
jgi:hypothetical protein